MNGIKIFIVAAIIAFVLTGTSSAGINDGLQAWYPFNGNANDESGHDYNGIVHNAVLTEDHLGNPNSAYYFDGSGDYIGLGNPVGLNFTGQITIAAWIRPDVIKGVDINRVIVDHGYGGSPIKAVYLRIANDGQYESGSYIQNSGDTGRAEYVIPLTDQGAWVHLVGLYDGTFWRLYRNGVEVASRQRTVGAIQVDWDWAIGARGTGGTRFFTGAIDDVRIYNRALSAEEVLQFYEESFPKGVELAIIKINTAIAEKEDASKKIQAALEKEAAAIDALNELLDSGDYGDLKKGDIVKAMEKTHSAVQHEEQSQKDLEKSIEKLEDALDALGVEYEPEPEPQIDPNLIAWWKLDETSGTIAQDSSGSNHGTLYGGPVWTTGQIDGALSFDGLDDYVSTASVVMTNTTNITMAGWVYWNAASANSVFFYNGHPGTNGYGVLVTNGACGTGNKITVLIGGENCDAVSSSTILPTNQWTHIALTREGTAWKLYVNGVYKHTGTTSPNVPSGTTLIGAGTILGQNNFNGTIDDVRFYNRALSATEVLQLYQGGL